MSTHRFQIIRDAAVRSFDFLKETTDLQTLWTKAIPLSEGAGFLLPVARLHEGDADLIEVFGRWREEAMHAYPTQFPVTTEGTRSWLKHRLLDVPDRMLFLITDPVGVPVGHVGFANASPDTGFLELDNLVRGSFRGHKEISRFAVEALLKWAEETIGPAGFELRVLASLPRVIEFDRRLGFVEVERTPLRAKRDGETLSLVPLEDRGVPHDYFVRMRFEPKRKFEGESMVLTAGPSISAREQSYAFDAARSGWNGQWSKYIKRFERSFADYLGRKHAIATSSCTGALHLSLLALGIGPGDEVIVPEITWVATANAVLYTGATPVFADVDPVTWCLDAAACETLITPRTKAIMPVHLYGHPAEMVGVMALAAKHGLKVVEDAAPAIGATVEGRKVGTFGDFGCFSFQGAKLLVTGEGGMLVTDDDALYERVSNLWDQGRDPNRTFWIAEQGWKYKMSNVQAAIGLGQLERVDELIEMKRRVFNWYAESLDGVPGLTLNREPAYGESIYWMSNIELAPEIDREWVRSELRLRNVDTRPVFPAISQYPFWPARNEPKPNAKRIGEQGINLPSGVLVRREQVEYVASQLKEILGEVRDGRACA